MTTRRAIKDEDDSAVVSKRFRRFESYVVIGVLVFAVAFNLVLLYPEVEVKTIGGNDRVMHLLFAETAVQAITRGQDFTDPWLGTMGMGIPAFHYYQHLPHVSVALVHVATLGVFPLADMLRWTTYLLLSIFPLSIYWSLRRFGFDRLTAAMGGLVASLIVTPGIFGFGYISYLWRGHGLYSQLWAMLLMPPAIATGYRVLREGRGYFLATMLLAVTLMSHVLYVYMAFITLGILTFIRPIPPIPFKLPWSTSHRSATRAQRRRTGPDSGPAEPIGRSSGSPMATTPESTSPMSTLRSLVEDIWRRWRRLAIMLLLVTAVTSYFLVPLFLDRQHLNRSVWHTSTMYDSHGHTEVLLGLIEGNLFDFDRFLSLTILVFVGFVICFFRWRKERYLIPVVIFSLWLLLYFGRSTWGSLIDVLPMSRFLHMHRFIAGVHLGGILLMAIALAAPWRWAVARRNVWYVAAALALTSLVLLPVYIERKSYLTLNADTMKGCQKLEDAGDNDLTALFEKLRQLPPGRIYAGIPTRDVERWADADYVGCKSVLARLHTEGLDMVGRIYQSLSLTSDVQVNFDEQRWEHYNLFNARYVVAPEGQRFPAFVKPLQQFGRHKLYQVETTGYFDLVSSDLTFGGGTIDFYPAASSWLASGLPGVKQHPTVLMGRDPSPNEGPVPLSSAAGVISKVEASAGPSRGTILSEEVGSDFFAADVSVERDSLLMLKVTYHPNWRATVDGVETETVMLMPSFVGVQLPPGDHKVQLEYRPRRLRMILLILGLLTLPLIALAEMRGEAFSSWFAVRVVGPASRWSKTRRR